MMLVRKRDFDRVCVVYAPYSLLLYLLYSSLDEIQKTFFVFDHTHTPKEIASKFENAYILAKCPLWVKKYVTFGVLWYVGQKVFRCPSFKGKVMFAQDHLGSSPIFLGKNDYTLLEDAPGVFLNHEKSFHTEEQAKWSKSRSFKLRKKYFPTLGTFFGHNENCKRIIATLPDGLESLRDKELVIVNLKELWNSSSEEKQRYILSVYDVTDEDVEILLKKKIVLYTQPLEVDTDLSEEEVVALYKTMLERYPTEDVVIKRHPRSKIDYGKYFPDVDCFEKKIPSQLLDFLGVYYERAVTITSTAAIGTPVVDWYGNSMNESRFGSYGLTLFVPEGVNCCKL